MQTITPAQARAIEIITKELDKVQVLNDYYEALI